MAGTLTNYSERVEDYVESTRLIIDANDLRDLDDAELYAADDGEQSA